MLHFNLRERGLMMSQNISDIATGLNDYIDRIKTRVQEVVEQVVRETAEEFFVLVEDRIRTMFNSVVQDFYASYTPDYYDRNESLYNILQTSIKAESLKIWFDPEQMTPFRSGYSGEDGLYDQVFRHGWHGGAGSGEGHPDPGKPYWRAPVPYYNRWGHEASMSSVSPLEDMKRRVDDYKQYGMKEDFYRLWRIHAADITINDL